MQCDGLPTNLPYELDAQNWATKLRQQVAISLMHAWILDTDRFCWFSHEKKLRSVLLFDGMNTLHVATKVFFFPSKESTLMLTL
jgi:hypothetical protein